jgi:mannose-1-phosphate guanylyltransferase
MSKMKDGTRIYNSIIFDYFSIGSDVWLVEKLVISRDCVDRNGEHFDIQEAALDRLITARHRDQAAQSHRQKAMAELLGTEYIGVRTA